MTKQIRPRSREKKRPHYGTEGFAANWAPDPRAMQMTSEDKATVRPRRRRCPQCKKLRMWYLDPNFMYGPNSKSARTTGHHKLVVDGKETKVCWLCWRRSPEGKMEETLKLIHDEVQYKYPEKKP